MSDAVVYLNGEFLPLGEARVSVLDRGFLFGDGVYEVIPVYAGRLFRLEQHLRRLAQSLAAIRLANPLPPAQWHAMLGELVQRNGGGDQSLYLQVTRGAARRDLAFPPETTPTLFAMSTPVALETGEAEAGIAALVVADIRWQLCNIKAITLLPSVLLRQQAIEQGAQEAIMLRDGRLTEGAASNVFIVRHDTVITPPHSAHLLPGITRDLVVELCRAHAIPCVEREVSETELRGAQEVWITSSPKGVIPVVRLDHAVVGDGQPGPLWRRVSQLYRRYQQAFREGQTP